MCHQVMQTPAVCIILRHRILGKQRCFHMLLVCSSLAKNTESLKTVLETCLQRCQYTLGKTMIVPGRIFPHTREAQRRIMLSPIIAYLSDPYSFTLMLCICPEILWLSTSIRVCHQGMPYRLSLWSHPGPARRPLWSSVR